ncbi:OmpA family protein [Hydrogenophaga sp.]|uniref:OmpA family protein n=1 Tax=Hydrogenophaga sp. TaxID=1904254 RepID=UPI0035692467
MTSWSVLPSLANRSVAAGPFAVIDSAMRTTLSLSAVLATLTLSGCAALSAADGSDATRAQNAGLVPQAARITDERILGDRKSLDAVQQRLRVLNEAGVPQSNYGLAKAQCWLDTAKTQYHENDRTGYVEASLQESLKIVQALEADKQARVGQDTPLVAGSVRLRDDLWARLNGYKGQAATLACTARTVACAEVRLVRAGHAQEQTGWRQATPHIAMVEEAVQRADAEAANCGAPKAAVAAAPAPAPVMLAGKESFVLLGDALFEFDQSDRAHLLPGGEARLREVAERLKQYRSIDKLTVVGHTDRLGSLTYNDRLSLERAITVRRFLESLGVKAAQASAEGRGETEPVTQGCSTTAPKAEQVQCLQADRRVSIEVTGLVK